jgi:DEP domain-containing protein 5
VVSPHTGTSITNWKSLTTPACLPLTTDFFPTDDELKQLYSENTYTVTPADDANPYQDDSANEMERVEALLVELISQRLSQGFQLIVSNAIEKIVVGPISEESVSSTISKFWNASKFAPNRISTTSPYYLSLGDHVHKLFFDSSGKNVEVKRYVRKTNYKYVGLCNFIPYYFFDLSFDFIARTAQSISVVFGQSITNLIKRWTLLSHTRH